MVQSLAVCPSCHSSRVFRDGLRRIAQGSIQRFLCRSCGYRFSQCGKEFNVGRKLFAVANPSNNNHKVRVTSGKVAFQETSDNFPFFAGENIGSHNLTTVEKQLNSLPYSNSNYRVCATTKAKNLTTATIERQVAGEKNLADQPTTKGKIIEFGFWLKKQGKHESTIETRMTHLRLLANRGAILSDPESVKKVLAMQEGWSDGMKANVTDSYSSYLQMVGLTWIAPTYKRRETIPFIPSEAELNQLIGSCGKILGTFLQGLKETGADPGELAAITPKDVNKDARTITLNNPVKGHRPRILPVSVELIRRLENITKGTERIFNDVLLRRAFYYKRKTTSFKLANPRLLHVTFITFRHWFGTTQYHKLKDILQVQRLMGHKNIQNTLIYIDLESKLYNSSSDGFTTRVANNVGEACSLIESEFEYVTGEYNDGGKIFRKKK